VVNRIVGLGRQCDFGRVVVSPPGWPDLAFAAVIAGLGLTSGAQIIQQARIELRMATA
jgi:hypothetical protein